MFPKGFCLSAGTSCWNMKLMESFQMWNQNPQGPEIITIQYWLSDSEISIDYNIVNLILYISLILSAAPRTKRLVLVKWDRCLVERLNLTTEQRLQNPGNYQSNFLKQLLNFIFTQTVLNSSCQTDHTPRTQSLINKLLEIRHTVIQSAFIESDRNNLLPSFWSNIQ